MLTVKHYSAGDNDWLVKRFEVFRSDGCRLVEKFIPRTDISIVFHFGDLPAVAGERPVLLEPFFAAPIVPEALLLNLDGVSDTFIAICNPTALSRTFGLDLTPRGKYGIDLPRDLFYPLWKEMSKLNTAKERIISFNRFVKNLQSGPYIKDKVDIAYEKIVEKGITFSLKEIIHECGASQRTMERLFLKRTGVTPKTLVRVIRLNYLWNKMKNANPVDYQDMVFDGRYFDQAHFINDFKSITGETPGCFFGRNLYRVKIMSGEIEGNL